MNKEWSLQSAFREMNRFEASMNKILTLTGPTSEEFNDLRESILAMAGDKIVKEQTVTVRYDLWEGDITGHFLAPMPNTGIADVVQVNVVDGAWVVTATVDRATFTGKAESRQEAVLNWLKDRLGIPKDSASQETQEILSIAQSALSTGGTWSDADRISMLTEALADIVKRCQKEI